VETGLLPNQAWPHVPLLPVLEYSSKANRLRREFLFNG
jgi:hypothetical protein